MADIEFESEDSLSETESEYSIFSVSSSDRNWHMDEIDEANYQRYLELADSDFHPCSFSERCDGIEAYTHPDYYVILPLTKQEIVHLVRDATFEDEESERLKTDISRAIWEANREIIIGEKFDLGEPGDWTKADCEVCAKKRALKERNCCGYKICNECTSRYVAGKVEMSPGSAIIECPNCDKYMKHTEVRLRLRFSKFTEATNRYYQKMRELFLKSDQYLCHNCGNILYSKSKSVLSLSKSQMGQQLDCDNCHFSTCAHCKSPWHADISCRRYLKGDKSMLAWARGTKETRMATRCPGCKSWFQRTEGCDHMTCSRCRTGFYDQCGCRYPIMPVILGSHSSKLSVFGCKNIFLKKHPVLRKTIRGSILASVVALAIPVGAVAIPVGAVGGSAVLAGYGGYKIGKTVRRIVSK